jgi:endonuclease/exonuclease/phosphatase (EEP) superfamily protein YafD
VDTDITAAERRAPGGIPGERRTGRRFAVCCAALLLAGVSVVVGHRVADSDGITPVPQLLAFLPWLLVPVGIALLLSLLGRSWLGLLWGVLLLGLLAWYLQPYGKTGDPIGQPAAELRILTSNVEFGQATGALVAAVREEKPDLVFVQECDDACARTLRRDLAADYPHHRAVGGDGAAGSVILGRLPLTAADGVEASMGMPAAVADVDGTSVRLQLAHPMPPVPGQVGLWRAELGRLRAAVAADTRTPTVVAGDFNASQDHAAFRRILDAGVRDAARLAGSSRAPSWPARTTPAFGAQIDHVLVSEDFSARDARFLDLPGTDHRALLVDLTLYRVV